MAHRQQEWRVFLENRKVVMDATEPVSGDSHSATISKSRPNVKEVFSAALTVRSYQIRGHSQRSG